MINSKQNKYKFLADREKLFNDRNLLKKPFKFCSSYSLLVEEYIVNQIHSENITCIIAAVGSFSRRELSPHSDIDLMFIFPSIQNKDEEIKKCVTKLWNAGIEVSHTVRDFSDIKRYLTEDLHSFTQFFETRFLIGDKNLYDKWNRELFQVIESNNKQKLIFDLFTDVQNRYKKHGRSPKLLEPNVKFTGGGLRDIHAVEWMYSIKNKKLLSEQDESSQTENFLKELIKTNHINNKAYKRLFSSYETILGTRNYLHLIEGKKNDWLEFNQQMKIAKKAGYSESDWKEYMHEYFSATTILNRFSKTMMKRYKQEFSVVLSDYLTINIDDDFGLKGDLLSLKNEKMLSISEMMRAFYYRCLNKARFEKNLRSLIIESIHLIEGEHPLEATSSVFFRELLKLPSNVGNTLLAMNEFSFLDILLPDFKTLNGFFEPGVYHCYTSDEHSILAIQNIENSENQESEIVRLFNSLPSRDLLYIAILLHDIGKPISVSGHEILGAEIATSIMQSLGYGISETSLVQFVIKHHLLMEQFALRRDLNDPTTLDNFISIFPSVQTLDHLYLLTYANLSAVNPQVLTHWKADLLRELYSKSRSMLIEQLSGKELMSVKSYDLINDENLANKESLIDHLDQVDDLSYLFHFSREEMNAHIREIENGSKIAIFFKEEESSTNITILSKDTEALLANICGTLTINGLSIHDAKIFTRRDGIVIDSFNITDITNNNSINKSKYNSIEKEIKKCIDGKLNVEKEFKKLKNKLKTDVNRFDYKPSVIQIDFEENDRFTIIDIATIDKIGLLYSITKKMSELGLSVRFAKISTNDKGIIDSFYIQKNNDEKLRESEYGYIRDELTSNIKEL